MAVLVSDTSILIDLDRGALLEVAFQHPLPMAVPDLLYERELANQNGPHLQQLGLGVVALVPDEVAFAQAVYNSSAQLSLPDCFALSLARRHDHILLTGDASLRKQASAHGVRTHGVLWLLDLIVNEQPKSRMLIRSGLEAIASSPRCRLPAGEVKTRLDRWRDESAT